jgi:hypothetical protein
MLDALYRAERYRELAEEFRNVAETCASTKMQSHYSQISKHYSTLAVRHFANYRQTQKRLVAVRQGPQSFSDDIMRHIGEAPNPNASRAAPCAVKQVGLGSRPNPGLSGLCGGRIGAA